MKRRLDPFRVFDKERGVTMADSLGQVTDPNAAKVNITNVRESEVKEELANWYARRCDQQAAENRKQYAMWSTPGYDGTVRLESQYAAGEYLARAQTWEKRAEAARAGTFLFDQDGQRDPTFLQPQIRALQQRCAAIGLCEYESQTRTLGNRF
jgi:hypothetical protein